MEHFLISLKATERLIFKDDILVSINAALGHIQSFFHPLLVQSRLSYLII